MKVAVLIDTWFPFVGGGQINAWEISKRLVNNKNEIEIVTRNCGKDNLNNYKNLKITKLGKLSKTDNDIARLKYLWQAFLYIYRNEFDMIVAHAFLPGLVAKMIMILKKKPAIFVVHGTSIGTTLNRGVKACIERFILTQVRYSAEITVSRDFLKIKNINEKIVYIPNGVDQVFFKSSSSVKRDKHALLFVGRLHPQKNLINLVEAMKLLNGENFPVKLTIVGDGPQKEEILNLIKKYKLESQIKLEGSRYGSDLGRFYQSSSAFILPSFYEGQPLTILEAWASKLPVIVSKTGDNGFLIKEGINGYFIKDQKNPKDIAEVIKQALKNKNLRKLGQNGYVYAKNTFSWNISAIMTHQLFKTLIK